MAGTTKRRDPDDSKLFTILRVLSPEHFCCVIRRNTAGDSAQVSSDADDRTRRLPNDVVSMRAETVQPVLNGAAPDDQKVGSSP